MNTIESRWNADQHLLVTRLSGTISAEDINFWQISLNQALFQIPDNSTFRLIVDFHGYEPQNLSVHKMMRGIIPQTLASYGFRTALLDVVGYTGDLPLMQTRGIHCKAVAHIHHNADKMREYDRRAGSLQERFFSDYPSAESWILSDTLSD